MNANLELKNTGNDNFILALYGAHGQLVRTITDFNINNIEIDKQNLTSGLYFFQMRTDKQVIATGKLTIG